MRGEVAFEDVHFDYGNGQHVVRGLSLHIPAGETAAIVGATGAGKSTVVKLLLRFYDVQRGRVLLDGHDLRELNLADLRGAIGLVSQDVFLFHGTVRENIAYGTFDATDEQIVAAAHDRRGARLHHGPAARATTPSSASAARSCPAASASASRSRAPCSKIRRC